MEKNTEIIEWDNLDNFGKGLTIFFQIWMLFMIVAIIYIWFM
jgi:hypothetical protein